MGNIHNHYGVLLHVPLYYFSARIIYFFKFTAICLSEFTFVLLALRKCQMVYPTLVECNYFAGTLGAPLRERPIDWRLYPGRVE